MPKASIVLIRLIPRWVPVLILVLSDALAVFIANRLALKIRDWLGGQVSLSEHFALWPFFILFSIIFATQRLYFIAGINPADEIRRVFRGTVIVYLIASGAAFLVQAESHVSRGAVLIGAIGSIGLVLIFRYIVRGRFARYGWWGEPVLVLGAGLTGQGVVRSLSRSPYLGWRPVAMLDDDDSKHGTDVFGVPVVAGLEEAPRLARMLGLRTAIVAMPGVPLDRLRELERSCSKVFPHLIVLPNFCGYASMWVSPKDLGGMLGLEVRRNLVMRWPRFCKRITDLALCGLGMLVVIPLTLLFAIAIKFSSPGPVFYGQNRIGRNGRVFKAWKFRSMIANADVVLKDYLAAHPELREEWERDHKLRDDPRVTAVGRILRKTSLDELPQIWNVLRGEMSLIGPRPIVEAEIVKYRDLFDLYLLVRPGISGLWQVSGRNDTTYDERVMLDAAYVRNWSVWLDVWILIRSFRVVVFGKGAY